VQTIPRLGHLAHEEAPETVADLVRGIADRAGLLAPIG